MTPRNYSLMLLNRVNSLPPRIRRLRFAAEEYITGLKLYTRYNLVRRLRSLSRYMRFGGDRWPRAVDKLFSMPCGFAEDTLAQYRDWYVRKGKLEQSHNYRPTMGFISLSRALAVRGALEWELKLPRMQHFESRWNSAPRSFRADVTEYLRLQAFRNLTAASMKVFRLDLTSFGEFLAKRGLDHRRLTYHQALAWFEELKREGFAPSTMNRRLCLMKRFYNWLRAKKSIQDSPLEGLQSVRLRRMLPQILDENEMKRLIRSAKAGRDRTMLEVLYSSGCRIGELGRMDLNKVSFNDGTARTIGKGGHERVLYLNRSAMSAIRRYMPVREATLSQWHRETEPGLFVSYRGRRLLCHSIQDMVADTGRRAGIIKHVRPHMIRHSFATHMLNRGADLYSIMRFLGHQSPATTERYLQIATARLSDIHKQYHPRR